MLARGPLRPNPALDLRGTALGEPVLFPAVAEDYILSGDSFREIPPVSPKLSTVAAESLSPAAPFFCLAGLTVFLVKAF